MGFANNLFPAELLPKITLDPSGYYTTIEESSNVGIGLTSMKCNWDECSLCYPDAAEKNTNAPKEIDVTVKLNAATEQFKNSVEARTKSDNATIDVTFSPYGGRKTGTLSVYVPSAYGEGTYANVTLDADDLKQVQDAIYKVRVEIAKADVKNEDVYPF